MDAKQLMLGDYVINTEFCKNEIEQIDILEPTRVWLKGGKTYVHTNYIEPFRLLQRFLKRMGLLYVKIQEISMTIYGMIISLTSTLYFGMMAIYL